MSESNKENNKEDSSDPNDKEAIREATIARATDRRERHQQRSLIVRVLAVVTGILLTIPGLVLVWLIPEVGLPLLLGGLRLLSLEFEWAAKAQGWVEWRTHQLRSWFGRQSLTTKIGVPLLLVAAIGFLLLWFVF